MPVFSYRALTLTGEARQGQEAADTLDHLRDVLATRDLVLKSARAAQSGRGLGHSIGRAKIPLKALGAFNRQFSVLIGAGVTIPQALAILKSRPRQPRLEAALTQALDDVTRGLSLSQAFDRQPAAFEAPYLRSSPPASAPAHWPTAWNAIRPISSCACGSAPRSRRR